MRIGLIAGTFDPITLGHLDIIERASKLVDRLHIVVGLNTDKSAMYDVHVRRDMIDLATKHLSQIFVDTHVGLMSDYAHKIKADCIIRGLRSCADFDYELQLMALYRCQGIECIHVISSPQYVHISSTAVRYLILHNADLSGYLPTSVIDYIVSKRGQR